ncbi:hypothetical protein ACI2LF_13875 [Kribbella sp. NPDC020789]
MFRRYTLAATMVFVGAALIFVGWLVEDSGYLADLLLQLGSTALLVVPVLYIERQLSQVRQKLTDLRAEMDSISRGYERARATEEAGLSRTVTLERKIAEARDQAMRGRHTAAAVSELFRSGQEGERIAALGMMQGNHKLVDADAIVAAISDSRSAFEQFHALRLAVIAWGELRPPQQDLVMSAVTMQMQPDGYIQPGTDRRRLAQQLQSLANSAGDRKEVK